MTLEFVEQSIKKLQKSGFVGTRNDIITWLICGTLSQYAMVKFTSFSLVGCSAGHRRRMWGRSSTVFLHESEIRHTPLLFFDQCLHKYSVLYLPESICAWTVAIATFEGEQPAVVHIGWILVNDIKFDLK